MKFDWDPVKDAWLREHRGVSFAEVITLIESGHLLAVLQHRMRPAQRILVVARDGYALNIPCVEDDGGTIFLKTIYPSRNSTKRFIGGER